MYTATRRWVVTGQVQGVGFRPFVYRLATRLGISGWVCNQTGSVEIVAQASTDVLEAFARALVDESPAIAKPVIRLAETVAAINTQDFIIRPSNAAAPPRIHVPVDYFTCAPCLAELDAPRERRYRYPFTNCTQCGPRYTLIRRLPYDRVNTSMADFRLCPACQAEYDNPGDRRFHAEPVACPACGPQLSFHDRTASSAKTQTALTAACRALTQGQIVAIRGIGGYHLVCDAGNDRAVMRLRERKPRPHKPLAVMFPFGGPDGLASVRAEVELAEAEVEILMSPVRPIVLARRQASSRLSPHIAPGLSELGVMLPYSPLHHLLAKDFAAPLVVTSANISGEPVLTEPAAVRRRLGHVADAFLHHNRPIVRPADDPVYRLSAGAMRPLRLGRGCAPLELALPARLSRPLLAVGAHMKATLALAWEDRVVVSPHIGDMGTQRSLDVFRQLVEDLQTLYAVTAAAVICDAHPAYATSRWAGSSGLPVTRIFHHRAHAAALMGEQPADGPCLVFTWDGTGYGEDGTLWGGEALLGTPGHWERKASFRPFYLPGGDLAGREPWRSAAALCWETDHPWDPPVTDTELLRHAWTRRLNAPQSSAAGRLFDAAASLSGLLHRASFEGQGPMYLEASSQAIGTPMELPLERDAQGILRSDWAPLLAYLSDISQPIAKRAADFHATLAGVILRQAQLIRDETGVAQIGLTGGVFQNRQLAEQAVRLLESDGFSARLPSRLPCNDAAISFGQIIEYLGSTATA